MRTAPIVSVILSTYNQAAWLQKVLWGYCAQTVRDFELVIADDGSDQRTRILIDSFRDQLHIIHVWQEDQGFQKTRILNKAIVQCRATYIIMSDGDCIPRADFIEVHLKCRKPNCFLSGGYSKLPLTISEEIGEEDIRLQKCFKLQWLKVKGLPRFFKNQKLAPGKFRAAFLNYFTPSKPTWNGHNASAWKRDILAVNGFDERMKYGGEDREMGERIVNIGIMACQIRYSAICLHLEHSRDYICKEALKENRSIYMETLKKKLIRTHYGVEASLPHLHL